MQELNEAEMFRAVLNEMLEELKQQHSGMKEMNKSIVSFGERIDGFQRLLENIQVVAPLPDLQPVKDQLATGVAAFDADVKATLSGMQAAYTQQLQRVTAALEAQPKPIVRRISIFPENDRHGNYKFFIKGLFLSIFGFGLMAMIYALVQPYFERRAGYVSPVQERSVPFSREGSSSSSESGVAYPPSKKKRRHVVADSVDAIK